MDRSNIGYKNSKIVYAGVNFLKLSVLYKMYTKTNSYMGMSFPACEPPFNDPFFILCECNIRVSTSLRNQ